MSPTTYKAILIVNTIFCVIAIPVAALVTMASVMGGAAAIHYPKIGATIVYLGYAAPVMPIVSIIGSWASFKWRKLALAFVALPWLYAAALAAFFGVLFAQA